MSISYSPCFQPLKVFSKSKFIRSIGALTLKPCNIVACMKKSSEDFSLASKVDFLLDRVKWDDKGLAVAIAQNVDTGAVLMQGFANREALSTTISSQIIKTTYRIIYLGKPDGPGPTCHTGSETCYYTPVDELLKNPEVEKNELALTTLCALESTINQRKAETSNSSNGKPSRTKHCCLMTSCFAPKFGYTVEEGLITIDNSPLFSTKERERGAYSSSLMLLSESLPDDDMIQKGGDLSSLLCQYRPY